MKIKKIKTFISSIFAILLTASNLSFCAVCAMDSSPATPSPIPADPPNQKSVVQNNEVKNHNETVAPSETTATPKVQAAKPAQEANTPAPPSTPSTQNTPAPVVPAAPVAPPTPTPSTPPVESSPVQHTDENHLPIQKSSEENSKDLQKADDEGEDTESEEEQKTPEDLPKVELDEIIFPEVMSPAEETTSKPKNFLAGIIAWTCIVLGIAIVIFVLIKGHHKGEIEPKTMKVHSSGHKKKTKRLLDDKYYKKR